jgi:hypothetical protein
LQQYLWRWRRRHILRKKNGPIVLIDSFGREAGAGLLPFDDLGVDGFETVVLKALSRRAPGSEETQGER